MSQLNLHEIIKQQQEQLAAMQVQIQALLVAQGGAGAGAAATGSNMGSHMEVAKPAIFNREAGRVGGFITACRLYIKMKLRGNTVVSRSLMVDFVYFYFLSFILFFFAFEFLFSIFRTTQVRGYQSCCHISHNLMA